MDEAQGLLKAIDREREQLNTRIRQEQTKVRAKDHLRQQKEEELKQLHKTKNEAQMDYIHKKEDEVDFERNQVYKHRTALEAAKEWLQTYETVTGKAMSSLYAYKLICDFLHDGTQPAFPPQS